MNRQALAWGLKNTTFKNTTGMTEAGHDSTARDIAVIAAKIIEDSRRTTRTTRFASTLQQHQAGQPQPAARP